MKVSSLIKQLEKFDPDSEVWIDCGGITSGYLTTIRDIAIEMEGKKGADRWIEEHEYNPAAPVISCRR